MDLEQKTHYFLFAPPPSPPPKELPGCRLVHLVEDVFFLSGCWLRLAECFLKAESTDPDWVLGFKGFFPAAAGNLQPPAATPPSPPTDLKEPRWDCRAQSIKTWVSLCSQCDVLASSWPRCEGRDFISFERSRIPSVSLQPSWFLYWSTLDFNCRTLTAATATFPPPA